MVNGKFTGGTPWSILGQRWGHPWHRMCSYLGTFPPSLASSMILMLSDPGDVILDPFSGRGTTLLESRLLGRTPLASDLNPIAVALSKSKNTNVTKEDVLDRINELESQYDEVLYLPEARVQSDDILLIFNVGTLSQLCFLRDSLVSSDEDVDKFLIGATLGVMHGSERKDGTSGYASISMPNTFSMSPNYVRRFVEKKLTRPKRNVFQILREKTDRLFTEETVFKSNGIVRHGDAKRITKIGGFEEYKGKVKLVLTSPPYLDVVNYAKQNWIRNWFMEYHEDYSGADSLDDELTLNMWLKFSEETVLQMKEMLSPDGVIAFVVGDVSKGSKGFISLAREFIQRVYHNKLFSYVGCFSDQLERDVKTTRIWGDTKGQATDTDRIVILSDRTPYFRHERLDEELYYGKAVIKSPPVDPDLLSSYALEFSHSEKSVARNS